MHDYLIILFSTLCAGTFFGCTVEGSAGTHAAVIEPLSEHLQQTYAPDRRTARVELELQDDQLVGYTTVEEAMDSLSKFAEQNQLTNQVRLLPDTAVGGGTVGIINVAVANLRSAPGHSQELATQALLGTPVRVLDRQNDWLLVQTPDRYIAWLEPGAMVRLTAGEAREWFGESIRIYAGPGTELRTEPKHGEVLSTLVSGSFVSLLPNEESGAYSRVRLPDGVAGYVETAHLFPIGERWRPKPFTGQDILAEARRLAGRPYLWGGTSPNGMDCSGFTKMAYYIRGYVVPRDASQQVHAGEEIPLSDDFAALKPGDQLFFGSYRDDGSMRVTHTGFYLGNGRFLHAGADNGRIRENSLVAGDEDFAEHRLRSLLAARRLRAKTTGVVPVGKAFTALLTGPKSN